MDAIRNLEPERILKIQTIDNPSIFDYKGQALITLSYDDGLLNNFYYALPLHEKYNIPATFNIIGIKQTQPQERFQFMDERKIRYCFDRGIEIASHSYYHEKELITETDEELHFEFSESIKVLEEVVGKGNVETLAVPFSKYDDRVRTIAMQYFKGVRVWENLQNDKPPQDRYWLHSVLDTQITTKLDDIKAVIDDAVANNKWCIIMLHGVVPTPTTRYEITPQLLEQTLQYIKSFGKDVLLPINTKDALKFTLGDSY